MEQNKEESKVYFTYLLLCADGSLYCGYTDDLDRRVAVHNRGKGAKYTKSRLPVTLVYCETFPDRHGAMRREWEIKRLTRAEKERLIAAAAENQR